ncbi:enoyl-CoA hydratase/isomerase family protein [Salinirubellus sp. GCM10025818]|uniref:enoyl-CoA hydratase/isomerase family protein n=1 Tax=Salinirubellus TaxID=2162630 RepID=UPI0030D0877B
MAYSAYEHISVDVTDGVATITLNRPEKYNALNNATFFDLQRAFGEIQLDRSVDVVVVEGAGEDAFSAGADIEQYAGPSEEHDPLQKERQDIFYGIYRIAYDCHAPVIAKIDGYCVGGGLIFAMYCDLRIADTTAKFGVPVTDIGQIPTGGSTYRAAELVGEAKAKELVYTAGTIDAEEAHRIGLVNDLVEPEELDGAVESIVSAIQSTGTQAVKNSKRAINAAVNSENLEEAREIEAEIWWEQFATDERRDLVDEFVGGE